MLDNVFHIVYQAYKWGAVALSSVAKIRDAILIDSRSYKEELGEDAQNSVREESIFTNASHYIDKINSHVPGLGHFVDYVFSPNVCLVIGAISAAAAFFSPLGIGVGIASVVILGTATIVGVILAGVSQKETDIKKQKTSIIKEMDKDLTEIENGVRNLKVINAQKGINVNIDKILGDTVCAKLSNLSFYKPETAKYSAFDTALSGMAKRFPVNGFMLGTGIATLNPLVIGLGVTSMVLGEASSINKETSMAKINADHADEMAIIKSKLGLPEIAGEQGLKDYAEILSEVKRTKFALLRFTKDYAKIIDSMSAQGVEITEERLREIFTQDYLGTQPRVSIATHIMSYMEALATSINNGWTWSDSMNAKSPLVDEYEWAYNDNAYRYHAVLDAIKSHKHDSNEDAEDIIDEATRLIKELAEIKLNGVDKLSQAAQQVKDYIDPKDVKVEDVLKRYSISAPANTSYNAIKKVIKEREERGALYVVKRSIGG